MRPLLPALIAALALVFAAPAPAADRAWLAGDLHVHSCASHDVLCVPDTETSEPWTLGLPVGARFAEAGLRGLDFLAITDHNDTTSVAEPGYGGSGVLGLPGYENSLNGHAQVLGVDTVLDNGDKSAAAVRALQAEIHARGGLLQANHPGDGQEEPFASCDDTDVLDWEYGYEVPVDSVEVLNPTSPATTAEAFYDCLLARGVRPALTGGSDSHWALLTPIQGAGSPTTWVHADEPTAAGLVRAIRAGRTSVSRAAPAAGGAPLLIERQVGDAWVSAIGEDVPAGTPLRVRSASDAAAGLVTVRGPEGALVKDAPLERGGALTFAAPSAGWARAVLSTLPAASAKDPSCVPNGLPVSTCVYDAALVALTSPVFVGVPEAPIDQGASVPAAPSTSAPGPAPAPAAPTAPAPDVRATSRSAATPLIARLRLHRATFGGRFGPLRVALRLTRSATIELRLTRDGHTFRRVRRTAAGPVSLTLGARGLRPGRYRLTVTVDGQRVRAATVTRARARRAG